jgi:chromopyrrolic acid synthase
MMRPLGELLMTMPSGKRGKTAGASFEIETPIYIPTPEIAYQSIARRFQKLEHQAKQCPSIPNTVCEMFQFYQKFFEDMAVVGANGH